MQKQKEIEENEIKEKEKAKQLREQQEQKLGDINGALQYMTDNYDVGRVQLMVGMLVRILTKIDRNPNNPKFCRININSPKINKALVRPLGGLLILRKLGFEAEGNVYVLRRYNSLALRAELHRFHSYLKQLGTVIPQSFSEIDPNIPREHVYFAACELKNILANVITLPDERNFRSVDTESTTFKHRLAPIPQIIDLLHHFGFTKKEEKDMYLIVNKPDIRQMEAGVNDLIIEIKRLGLQTPIYRATRFLLKKNTIENASLVVDKLTLALNKIITTPQEQKYHKIKLDKFFSKTGLVDGGKEMFPLFGFQIDVPNQTAQISYPQGFDLEFLKLRVQDFQRSWKDLLTKRAKQQAKQRQVVAMEE